MRALPGRPTARARFLFHRITSLVDSCQVEEDSREERFDLASGCFGSARALTAPATDNTPTVPLAAKTQTLRLQLAFVSPILPLHSFEPVFFCFCGDRLKCRRLALLLLLSTLLFRATSRAEIEAPK
jgi:hypothetical protein